jgi:hypothetical protein
MKSYNQWSNDQNIHGNPIPWPTRNNTNPWGVPQNPYQPNIPPNNMGIGKLGTNINIGRKFRWTLELKYKDSTLLGPFFVKVASRPNLNIEETTVDYLSDKYWVAGQSRWQDLQVSAYIDGQSAGDPKTAEHQIVNGMGELAYAQGLTGMLRLWDGCGTELENWELKNMFCQNIQSDLEYSSSDITVEMTFKYSEAKYSSTMQPWTPGELAAKKRQALIDKARAYAPHLRFTEF